jgi:small subunit ribosomal protein S13
LPPNKHVEIGLTYIYGIGLPMSKRLLGRAKVDGMTRVKDLSEDEVRRIARAIQDEETPVEGDLRRDIAMNIKRLMEIGCYRGAGTGVACRSAGSGPTNARTRKGPRRATVAKKKKATKT